MPSHPTVRQETVQLSAQQPVRVQDIRRLDHDVPTHDHEFCEVVLVRSGSGLHVSGQGQRALRSNDLLILKPGHIHGYREVQDLSLFNVYYLAEALVREHGTSIEVPALSLAFFGHHLFPRHEQNPIHISIDSQRAQLISQELSWLAALPASEHPSAPLLRRSSWMKICALLSEEPALEAALGESPLQHPIVRHVHTCVERCLQDGQAADVAAWAASAGMHPDYFTSMFRKAAGEGPSAYHQRRRLQRAADRLIHSNDSLTDIALALGFSDSAHFSRSFRAFFQTTPSAYRKRFCA